MNEHRKKRIIDRLHTWVCKKLNLPKNYMCSQCIWFSNGYYDQELHQWKGTLSDKCEDCKITGTNFEQTKKKNKLKF